MTASVALVIAVDDSNHLSSRFTSRRGGGLGEIRAAWGAISHSDQPHLLHDTRRIENKRSKA
jgi:hypothetical protein